MKRRIFLQSGSAAMATALTACGGGGGAGTPVAGSTSTDAAVVGTTVSAAPVTATAVPATAPAAAPAQAPAQQATSSIPSIAYPFGSRLTPYVAGIVPSNASNAQMDARIAAAYAAWKSHGIVDVPAIAGGKALRFTGNYIAVSESIGYAMLITVVMAGHDPEARSIFDGLLKTARARPAYGVAGVSAGGQYLMEWRLDASGNSAGEGWSATDGDLDIAMALLMADKQWGSTGSWNYKQEALNTIGALKAWNLKPDGTLKGAPDPNSNRTSDYMIGHFRAFKRATGDAIWDRAVDRACALLDFMQATYSPACGLIPDFVVKTDGTPAPSPGFIGDGTATEGDYFANAQRDPWRLGTDYVLSGDARVKAICQRFTSFMQRDCGGNPGSLSIGYHLDGSSMGRDYLPKAIAGPLQCGAMVDAGYQPFLNSLWTWTSSNFVTDYYDSELMLLPMIVASGNWWTA